MYNLGTRSRRDKWKESEKAFLREHADELSDKVIAKKLNKTIKAVREARYRMGIRKKPGRGIIGVDTEFQARKRKKKQQQKQEREQRKINESSTPSNTQSELGT